MTLLPLNNFCDRCTDALSLSLKRPDATRQTVSRNSSATSPEMGVRGDFMPNILVLRYFISTKVMIVSGISKLKATYRICIIAVSILCCHKFRTEKHTNHHLLFKI